MEQANLSKLQKKLKIFSDMVKVSCRWKVAGELLLPDPICRSVPDPSECLLYTGKICSWRRGALYP